MAKKKPQRQERNIPNQPGREREEHRREASPSQPHHEPNRQNPHEPNRPNPHQPKRSEEYKNPDRDRERRW